jgi:hypothetical protein
MDVQAGKRRLGVMLAINLVCLAVAGGAAFGAFSKGVDWLLFVFAGALVSGVGTQIWFIAGFKPTKKGV